MDPWEVDFILSTEDLTSTEKPFLIYFKPERDEKHATLKLVASKYW